MNVEVVGHDHSCHCHKDDGNERAWYLLIYHRSDSDDDHTQHSHYARGNVFGAEVLDIARPLAYEVRRYGTLDVQTEEVLDLCREDGEGDTRCETNDDRIRDVADDSA